ncbi:MAG: carbon-nitrogen hydrolase family protein [Planctomycetota bacterium]
MKREPVRVAVAQATPVMFDPIASARKVAELAGTAGKQQARLVLLPEAFVPAYPRGLGFGTVVGSRSPIGREDFQLLWDTAVEVPGEATSIMAAAAREASIYVAVGVVERSREQHGTLFCSLLVFNDRGELVLHHRKLRPTGTERLMWGEGDGSTLTVFQTPFGRVGGLICWENYMPLARTAIYAQGVELYLAPTADARDSWQATLQHIACEGRCFVLGCNQWVRREDYPSSLSNRAELADMPDIVSRGGSAIYSPFGDALAGPVWGQEELLICDLDLNDISRGKFDLDVVGHYARPDVFELRVHRSKRTPVSFRVDDDPETNDHA